MRIVILAEAEGALCALAREMAALRADWEVALRPPGEFSVKDPMPVDVLIGQMPSGTADLEQLFATVKQALPGALRMMFVPKHDPDKAVRAMCVAQRVLSGPVTAPEAVEAVARLSRLQQLMGDWPLHRWMGQLDALPPAPDLYLRVTRILEDPNADAIDVGRIVAQDPALTAKILQLCNSVMFAARKQISDVRLAITRLGWRNLRSVVLACEVFAAKGARAADIERLQQRALTASIIAERITFNPTTAEMACTAALLAEVGQLLPGLAHDGDVNAGKGKVPAHAAAGAYLLGLWGLPMPIVEAVAYHHCPGLAPETTFGVAGAVHLACALVAGEPIDEAYVRAHFAEAKLARAREVMAELMAAVA